MESKLKRRVWIISTNRNQGSCGVFRTVCLEYLVGRVQVCYNAKRVLTEVQLNTPARRVSLHTIALPADSTARRCWPISRVTDDAWTEAVSEDTGPGSVTRADVVIRQRRCWVSMTTTTSLRLPELISHMEGICVVSARVWLHSRRQTLTPPIPPTDDPTQVMCQIPNSKYRGSACNSITNNT